MSSITLTASASASAVRRGNLLGRRLLITGAWLAFALFLLLPLLVVLGEALKQGLGTFFGAIFEADHANSIIAAGRAELCAIARPHLANPAWTLAEAAKLGYGDIEWPRQYRTAKAQLERNLEREKQAAAANAGLTPQQIAANLLGT